eukprot:7369041-Prymnesium_polylepis.2
MCSRLRGDGRGGAWPCGGLPVLLRGDGLAHSALLPPLGGTTPHDALRLTPTSGAPPPPMDDVAAAGVLCAPAGGCDGAAPAGV